MDEKKPSIFRKETLERISSPEQLNDYLHVTSPGIWIVLAAIIVELVGFFVWMSVGTLETTVAVGVATQNHKAEVTVTNAENKMAENMVLRVADKETVILSTETDSFGRTVGRAEVDLPDGMYDGTLVTESVHPISFLLTSK